MDKFDTYITIKNDFDYRSNDISYNNILTPEFIKITFFNELFMSIGFVEILKIFFRQVCFSKLATAFIEKKIISTNCNDRKDNLDLISHCFEAVEDYRHVKLTSLKHKYRINHNIDSIVDILKFFFASDKKKYDFKIKLYLAVTTIYYTNAVRSLDKIFSKIELRGKKYVAFNSSYDLESLLCQYLSNKGVETYHLSHGFSYVKYKLFRPFDCVNGENLTAKNILVWGDSSRKDLIENYKPSLNNRRIVVAGNPKYPFKNIHLKKSFNNGIVFLCRNIYDEGNIELLNIIGKVSNKTGIKFSIKIHPFSDENKIRKYTEKYNMFLIGKEQTISEILSEDKYDFAICYNTTVYYESMYFNMYCFRYGVGENESFLGLDDKFHDEKELDNLINIFKSLNSDLMIRKVEELLINTLGMGINKYKQILQDE